jgi:hypothetical protein
MIERHGAQAALRAVERINEQIVSQRINNGASTDENTGRQQRLGTSIIVPHIPQ